MVSLTKGQKVSLTKESKTSLTRINVGLGWDEVLFGRNIDCDASCVGIKKDDSIDRSFLVYFGNKTAQGVMHSGDNLTGGGSGDDETIQIELNKLPSKLKGLIFFMNIYDANDRKQSFKNLKNAFIRIYNPDTNEELTKFSFDEYMEDGQGFIAGKVYFNENEWHFEAVGQPVHNASRIDNVLNFLENGKEDAVPVKPKGFFASLFGR